MQFGIRLLAAVVGTYLILGVVTYLLIAHQLESDLVHRHVSEQQSDARTFEAIAARSPSGDETIRRIGVILEAIGNRPGTREALLIDSSRIVRASRNGDAVGGRDTDARIDAALDEGRSYAGHEADPARAADNFEFVIPLDLPQGRYVFEISHDAHHLHAQLSDVRRTLLLILIVGVFASVGLFYVLGGRTLLRSHRIALARATQDGLTDLPNQRAFQDEVAAAVAVAERHESPLALAVIDLDDFKQVNDQHGHPAGDALLKRAARVLHEGRAGDRAFRTGGDEFALLLQRTDADGARTVARRVSRALREVGVPASIGVSEWRPGQPDDALRAEADAAVYEAKRRGGGLVADFEDIREHAEVTTQATKTTVRALIDEGRLTTVVQPIWDLHAGTLLGVEALTRPDPSYGLSGPAEAFDVAQQIGRVQELDAICVRSALERVSELTDDALLFLNVSPHTLDFEPDETAWLLEAVLDAGLSPERIVVEVTERFPRRTDSVIKTLRHLRSQGFRLALDDVGTGNSGLEMLRRVDADFVKIDRSIVADAPFEPNARAVLMAIATFAHQTGAFVIAEGIEDGETLDFLRRIDHRDLGTEAMIQGGQGYGLGRPSPELPASVSRAPATPVFGAQAP
jgi:diguanylate cyclase (GGDEF)-like protein